MLLAKDVELSVKALLDAMAGGLTRGDRIEIRGFGTFHLNQKKPHTGRNPKTGEKVQIPAKYRAHFKPGKELRERVNQDYPPRTVYDRLFARHPASPSR